MAVIDNDEVLLARMVSGATMASSRRSNSCLASRRSTMASTTSSQSPSCSRRSATRSRFCAASASARSACLAAQALEVCRRRWRASAAASARLSNSHTVRPAWAAHLGDPGAHRTGTDHGDTTNIGHRLFPLVVRRAFLQEGLHAFLLVLRVEQQLERLAFQGQGTVQRQVGTGQDHLLDLRQRREGAGGRSPWPVPGRAPASTRPPPLR